MCLCVLSVFVRMSVCVYECVCMFVGMSVFACLGVCMVG